MTSNTHNLSDIQYLFLGIRHQSGLNKEQFEMAPNIHTATLTKLETGKQRPTLENLERYARFLNCKVYQLLQAVEEQNQFSYLIRMGKERNSTKQKYGKINIFKVFNALSDEDKKRFLEEAISQI